MRKFAQVTLAANSPELLTGWWLHRMRHTPAPLLEKTTLFWHGHFATSAEKVRDPKLMFEQNELFRSNALGRFEELVRGIARDPAMLIYLDSATNRKMHPNENFAREVMELFCLGVGNYSEKDIQQLARCFTGWEIQYGKFKFNPYQHDYGNKTVLGQVGPVGRRRRRPRHSRSAGDARVHLREAGALLRHRRRGSAARADRPAGQALPR